MDRDTTIILGAVFAALASGLGEEGAAHAVKNLNQIADELGSRRGNTLRIIAKGISEDIEAVIKAAP